MEETIKVIDIKDVITNEVQKIMNGKLFKLKVVQEFQTTVIFDIVLNFELETITLFELKERYYLKRSGNYGFKFFYQFTYYKNAINN